MRIQIRKSQKEVNCNPFRTVICVNLVRPNVSVNRVCRIAPEEGQIPRILP